MKAVYVDDFNSKSKPVKMTEEEMERRNKELENQGIEEYGMWIKLSKIQED
jgi:hypothetical protein